MRDDLVKRYTTYNVMMSKESGKYISSPDGKWVLFTDHADRIEKLEAKLAKAAEALVQLVVEYDEVDLAYDEPTSMTSAVNVARLITAELKGETNAPE